MTASGQKLQQIKQEGLPVRAGVHTSLLMTGYFTLQSPVRPASPFEGVDEKRGNGLDLLDPTRRADDHRADEEQNALSRHDLVERLPDAPTPQVLRQHQEMLVQ